MTKPQRALITVFIAALLSTSVYSEVPVVDNSENYALLEEQTQLEQPVTRSDSDWDLNDGDNLDIADPHQGEPLAEEDTHIDQVPVAEDAELPLAHDTKSNSNPQDNAMLLSRIQTLQEELQELRGQLEVQAHDLKLLQQQQLAFYKDLDARLAQRKAEPNIASNQLPAASPLKNEPQVENIKLESLSQAEKSNPADEQISYLKAYELIKNKQYDKALEAMNTFVQQYPQSGYTPNAQYWLGELYLVNKNYEASIQHFDVVLQKYPSSNKAAACLLKIGYALAATGKKEDAKVRLEQVVKEYPDTNTAQLATAKLKTLGS